MIDQTELKPYYHHAGATLSEGITYVEETDTLYWIDIYKAEIHRVTDVERPESSHCYMSISRETYDDANANISYPEIEGYQESVGTMFMTKETVEGDGNVLLFASKWGIGRCDLSTKKWEYVKLYSDCKELKEGERFKRLRSNDGNVTPDGKYLYVGLMNDFKYDVSEDGCIVKISLVEDSIEIVWNAILIPNSINWYKNDVYITDSLKHRIWRCEYDYENDTIGEKREILIHIKEQNNQQYESPEPDGSVIDSVHGILYQCVWSTSKVQVYDLTKDGLLMDEIVLPNATSRISCCSIAKNDLFVTCGNLEISDEEYKATDRSGGCIYRIRNILTETPRNSRNILTSFM
ncbi:hypothetical protein KAFR_0C00530 [Kazachstania africana CBS 2517]|uniref:SMP-30/Gluconolactonase/LRE-like region domain-containing protein n=1 Tax=Kazachstania africana (strain ATCC 22294 / BCRC 22015 / CBS 2517 / CECT 1963 / NBRC 1671 / NRRL Y-8276) TaxID=1071382 RepID=H2ARP8_KAZAF|nr:hypothetical protein KAFR_0C00530 [Kazachstania africana CBS 2517]CCF57048.1 hypothetical protein KAFR_0C00530 [Kazachstania africana CBS 2517]